jgi:hypothetical protein
MSTTVDFAFVHAFHDNIHRLASQMDSKLRQYVRVRTGVVGKTDNWERLGGADLVTLTSRHQATPIINPEHSRRRLIFTDKAGAVLLDDVDQVKMLISPQSEYARILAESANRNWDDLIIAAATGNSTAVSNADATSSITLASYVNPGGANSGSNVIANGSTNLTTAKVKLAKLLLDDSDVEESERYFVSSPAGIRKLLDDTAVTSSDYNTVKALVNGEVDTWMGFKFIKTTRLAKSGNVRTCFAFQRKGLALSIAIDNGAPEIDRRPDLNNSIQVLMKISAGSVRVEEARVVSVDIDETA